MSEWTPTDDEAASMFITGWCCDTNPETARTEPASAWSRFLAAHDKALREQIAHEIDTYLDDQKKFALSLFNEMPQSMIGAFTGLSDAASIARGDQP